MRINPQNRFNRERVLFYLRTEGYILLKRVFTVFAAVLVIGTSAAAAAGVYRIDEINAVISVPDSCEVYMRGESGFDSGDDSAVLVAVPSERDSSGTATDEITVTVSEDSQSAQVYNLSRLTKGKLNTAAGQMLSYIPKADTYDLFENEQVTFIKTSVSDGSGNAQLVFSEIYATIVNGRRISVILNSYDSEITDSEREMLKSITASMKFDKILTGGMTDYNRLTKNCIAAAAVILVIAAVTAVVLRRRTERPRNTVSAMPKPKTAERETAEPVLNEAQYKPQIAVHILDDEFGYSLSNWSEAREFAEYVDEQNALYLHVFTDESGRSKTEAMNYSAWMQLKREHDASHFDM